MKIVSLFSGCGGLDLGFEQAGFHIICANEFDKTIWETYEKNHHAELVKKSITDLGDSYFPDCDGIIGGPPCQSWSIGGNRKGVEDSRGKLFYDYIRILKAKKPKFFLAENVKGILSPRHREGLSSILESFEEAGYNVVYKLLNSNDYYVPQKRERVIFVGIRSDLGLTFNFPKPKEFKPTLRDHIFDLRDSAVESKGKPCSNLSYTNHEYINSRVSPVFLWGNRVESWDAPSRTIPSDYKFTPFHPDSPSMIKCDTYPVPRHYKLVEGKEDYYRRLSIRECARIQTFPDEFIFYYNNVKDGYKMVGNAVPVELSRILARQIKRIFI